LIEPHPVVARIERSTRLKAWAMLALTLLPGLVLIAAALWRLW
jgi:hypothetical protein